MPDLGRFFNVDPLAEDYVYNSPYAFAENRVIDGIEIEGLEWKSIKDEETGNTTLQLTVQLYNDSSLNENQLANVKEAFTQQFQESFSGDGFSGELIIEDVSEAEGDFLVTLNEQTSTPVTDDDGNVIGIKYRGGKAGAIGETQKNNFEVTVKRDGSIRSYSDIARSFSHEAGHTGGLWHPWSRGNKVDDVKQGADGVERSTIRSNLMNSDANPVERNRSSSGKNLTNGQLKSLDEIIRGQQ